MFKNQPSSSPSNRNETKVSKQEASAPKKPLVPPTVNFHLTKYCNMKCTFCYATFHDLGAVKHDFQRSKEIVSALAAAGFQKITFAGGEPTLVKELPELARLAKELGMVTTIVSNGSRLEDQEYYEQLVPHLDWVAISIDSIQDEVNVKSGRALAGGKALSAKFYVELLQKLRSSGVKTKINTVVSSYNAGEDLTEFINLCQPTRWKILQALPVEGQNSAHFGEFEVHSSAYKAFVDRHSNIASRTVVVSEEIELIKGSYIMVSPEGKFYDNTGSGYVYSDPILSVGVEKALDQINFDPQKFDRRGGNYEF